MKCEFIEHESCFEISFEAETKEEAVALARFGINKTKELRSAAAMFNQNGSAMGSVLIGKRKESSAYL